MSFDTAVCERLSLADATLHMLDFVADPTFLADLSPLLQVSHLFDDADVFRIALPLFASLVPGYQDVFDVVVQLVQIDIGKNWADDSALRRSAKRRSPVPFVRIPGLQNSPDQFDETAIVDLLAEDR
jgi:hypothetical protein